jgi:hypothetical protein
MGVRQQSKHELVVAQRERYMKAGRREKGRVLDEFVKGTGYSRKWAIELLDHGPPPPRIGHGGRPLVYSAVVVGALRVAAEASDWLCGKRLAPFLAELVPALEQEGALQLEPTDRERLLAMSAATIDRRLKPFRLQLRPHGMGTTKPGTLLKQQVPIRTFTPWEDEQSGFVEIDLVAHCGPTTAGHYLNTLTVTDVATGWTECIGVWGKGQAGVFAALKDVRERLPFPLLGIDSDNGSEFLNDQLVRYCEAEQLTFTRSRPYWKNDQAHVEQKNWSMVRRHLGYGRYESQEALMQLNVVYGLLGPWVNHWQPAMKLVGKERDGAKVVKHYDLAQTPYKRVLATALLSDTARERLITDHESSRPLALRAKLDEAIQRFWPLQASRETPPAEGRPTDSAAPVAYR